MRIINPLFYKMCSEITEKYEQICGRWELDSQLFHIVTEVSELKDVLRNKNEKYGKSDSEEFRENVLKELADIFLTTFATANYLGVESNILDSFLEYKLKIVKERVNNLTGVNHD